MKPLNILHTESSLGWGGQEIRILNESLGMQRRGYRLFVAAPPESTIFSKARCAELPTFSMAFKKNRPSDILKLAKLMKELKIDVVNTHSSFDSWLGTLAAKFSPLKPLIIRTRHLSTPISSNPLSRLIYDILPHAVITTGEEIKQRMVTNNRFKGEKIFSIPTGVDLANFHPGRVTASLDLKGFSIGMISVLRSWKGHRYFLEAVPTILEAIPEATFHIVGDGPQLENIQNMIKTLALEKTILMYGHREDIPETLAALDIIVHPSYANEGVPQSILQALAMEKAVVASDAGAIKEVIVDNFTGFLTKPKDSRQLAEKVIALYRGPMLRMNFGKEGRKLVSKFFSLETMLDKIEVLYEKILLMRRS